MKKINKFLQTVKVGFNEFLRNTPRERVHLVATVIYTILSLYTIIFAMLAPVSMEENVSVALASLLFWCIGYWLFIPNLVNLYITIKKTKEQETDNTSLLVLGIITNAIILIACLIRVIYYLFRM